MERLFVDFEGMQQHVSKMNDLCDDYCHLYRSLINKVDESSLYWKGKDQQAFISRIHDFESDFDRLHGLLQQYVDFLEKSISSYRMCQDMAESSAYRLS